MSSILSLVEDKDFDEFKMQIRSALFGILDQKLAEKAGVLSEEGADVPDPAAVAGTLEDPIISQGFEKEYFFKRFMLKDSTNKDREILIKRVGLGQNAPSIAYVDGIRYEVFMTTVQAERESIRAVKDGSFDLIQKKKEEKKKAAAAQAGGGGGGAAPAAEMITHTESLDFLASIVKDRQEKELVFENGDSRNITINEAVGVLEMIKLLNKENRDRFLEQMWSDPIAYQEMMNFLLDRIRKGVI